MSLVGQSASGPSSKTQPKPAFAKVPRYRCFALSDFHQFERCPFAFFVKHHLGKKYELEEGSPNKALGCILDLTIKRIHSAKAYNLPIDSLIYIVKAAEREMRENVASNGALSYYGPQAVYLDNDLILKAQRVLKDYYLAIEGKFQRSISSKTFWDCLMDGTDGQLVKLWGGPDALEMGWDGIPEIVDYKYFEDNEQGKDSLDMDLMPRLYSLLCAPELKKQGFQRARFRIRLWQDPNDQSLYEEFDLDALEDLKPFFSDKIDKILSVVEMGFCDKDYCKVCKGKSRDQWMAEVGQKVWLKV